MLKLPDKLLPAIEASLQDTLGLRRAADGNGLFNAKRRKQPKAAPPPPDHRYLVQQPDNKPLRVTVSQEFELDANGIVVDHSLGTIGLIQICCAGDPELEADARAKQVDREVDRFIREAVYMRHLLLEHAADQGQPYFVELVLVVPWNGLDRLPLISQSLRRAMQETTYLHAIGLNIWTGGKVEDFQKEENVRRAFPWLLTAVRQWYSENSPVNAEPDDATSEAFDRTALSLKELTLSNFRLPGKRTWTPHKDFALHLIHGQNGTGKSSLTEAVELLLTGRIQRLGEPDAEGRYARILTNDKSTEPAGLKVTVSRAGEEKAGEWTIDQTGLQPTDGRPALNLRDENRDAGSFRLEQTLTDELVRSSEAERAGRFLRAFFPEERPRVEAAQTAETRYEKAWNNLNGELKNKLRPGRGKPPMKDAAETLEWLDSPTLIVPTLLEWASLNDAIKTVENLPPALISPLPKIPEVSDPQDAIVLTAELKAWDEAWQRAVDQAQMLVRSVERLRPCLVELDEWQAGLAGDTGSIQMLGRRMNEWLESHVVWDLSTKEVHVVGTLRAARQRNVSHPLESLRLARVEIATSDESAAATQVAELHVTRQRAREIVATFRLETTDVDGKVPGSKPRFTDELLADCDRFFPAKSSASVKEAIHKALQSEQSTSAVLADGTTVMPGEMGGAKPLIEHLDELAETLRQVGESGRARRLPLADIYGQLSDVYEATEAGQAADEQVVQRFCNVMQPNGLFDDARNELMALLTPARWAYEDLSSDYRMADGTLDFKTHDVSAFLRLNAAELNIFSLALFLLRAPLLPNRLNLLTLDDPFPNMDELTVTTVVRGIGRLIRHWGETSDAIYPLSPWRLVITLHGEENVERFRREIPCAVYFLPWLGASKRQEAKDQQATEQELPIWTAPPACQTGLILSGI